MGQSEDRIKTSSIVKNLFQYWWIIAPIARIIVLPDEAPVYTILLISAIASFIYFVMNIVSSLLSKKKAAPSVNMQTKNSTLLNISRRIYQFAKWTTIIALLIYLVLKQQDNPTARAEDIVGRDFWLIVIMFIGAQIYVVAKVVWLIQRRVKQNHTKPH